MNYLTENPMLVVAIVMLLALVVFSSRAKKKMEAQEAQRQQHLRDEMKPGAWVMTASGFWGRFVDIDGETVILETPDGTETYWKAAAVVNVGGSPFPEDDEADEAPEVSDEDDTVLGLPTEPDDTPSR